MVNVVKKELRKQVLKKVNAKIALVGEDKSLMASAALLRAKQKSISRAALMDCMLVSWKWGKLRKTPDLKAFNELTRIINNLDDIDKANIVFASVAGEGAAWAYLEEIDQAINGANNRFTREISQIITKAREKNDKMPNLPKRGK